MKKALILLILLFPAVTYAQLTVPQGGTGSTTLSGILYGIPGNLRAQTVTIGNNLIFTGGTLSASGGGNSGVATSSLIATYPVKIVASSASINFSLLDMATTTATCTGSVSCSSFVIIGTSPITITGTSASSTLLSDNNTWTGINLFTNASSNFGGTWQTFLPSHFQVAGTYVTSVGATYPLSSSGGTTPIISSATSSTGSAGVLSAADWTTFNNKISSTSLSASSPLSYSPATGAFTCSTCSTTTGTVTSITSTSPLTGGTITTTGSIGIQAASNSQNGYLAAADFALFHTATTTFSSPLVYTTGTNAVTCATCLVGNQNITLTGAVTGSGTTAITTAFGTAGANTVLANGTSATAIPTFVSTSTLFNGSVGQNAYFSSNGNLVGTSTIFTSTASLVGIASTTPWARLSVDTSNLSNSAPEFLVGSTSRSDLIVTQAGNVGIGTANPTFTFVMQKDGLGVFLFQAANSTGPIFAVRQSNGTNASPVTTNVGDVIGRYDFNGFNSTSGTYGTGVQFQVSADTGWDSAMNDHPGRIDLRTSPLGSAGLQNRLSILSGGNVGVSTSTPWGTLSVASPITYSSNPVFIVASSTTDNLFSVLPTGQITASSTAPTLSACGSSPSEDATADGGYVTVGSVATGCTITFPTPWPKRPECTVTEQTSSLTNVFGYTVSATAIVITQAGISGDIVNFHCGIGE